MLSWSVIEYEPKFRAIGEYHHVIDLIRWGSDYILLTFDSNSSTIDKIYTQVGESRNNHAPNDLYCWMRPEDMDYGRAVQYKSSAPDLAAEMAAALAAAAIVFYKEDHLYSEKLFKGAETVFTFARDQSRRTVYSWNDGTNPYNSTGFWDEYIWAATWLFFASGDSSYLSLATSPSLAHRAKADVRILTLRILSWDNKLPAATLLLTRSRLFSIDGPSPIGEMLRKYDENNALTMCSFLKKFKVFNFTKGGLIQFETRRQGHALADAVNAAFLASLYADYMTALGIPGWYCGDEFIPSETLREFATSQVDYILGKNPQNISYVVGYGMDFPKHVHHRGASIPHNGTKYSCTGGWKWRDTPDPNPNVINGAMVGGPNAFDQFHDLRPNSSYTEPTLVANAGLVASLVSLTRTGGLGFDKNNLFSRMGPRHHVDPPPPPLPWKP